MQQAELQKAHADLIDEYGRLLDSESRHVGLIVWPALLVSIILVFALAYFSRGKITQPEIPRMSSKSQELAQQRLRQEIQTPIPAIK